MILIYKNDSLSHWENLPFDTMCNNNTNIDSDINKYYCFIFWNFKMLFFWKMWLTFFQNKCYHISQKCIFENEIDNFLFFTFDDNNKLICYYNTVFNIKNKQCGNKLNFKELNNCYNRQIIYHIKNTFDKRDYIRKYGQTITLLKTSKKCPNKHPKILFFYYPKGVGNQTEYNKTLFSKYEFEKITITHSKYYIKKIHL